MELDLAVQSTAFLNSILPGAALGVFYGAIKFLRALLKTGRTATFALDVLFALVFWLCLFIYSLAYLNGSIRAYVFTGFLAGFAAYRLTAGRLLSKIYYPVIRLLYGASHKIQIFFKKIAEKLLKILRKILYNNSIT